MSCPFCRPSTLAKAVWQNEQFVAVPDIRPRAKPHVLVFPRQHVLFLAHADSDFLQVVARVAKEVLHLDAYQVVINQGGTSVPHLHAHIKGA